MLRLHEGPRTEAGVRENIRVGVQYIAAWLGGRGAVPLYNLMEDAATAEICRAQLWQWLRFEAPLDDGRALTRELFAALLDEEMAPLAAVPRIGEARGAVRRPGPRRGFRGIPDDSRLPADRLKPSHPGRAAYWLLAAQGGSIAREANRHVLA